MKSKKIILTLALLSVISSSVALANTQDFRNETPEQRKERMAWWTHDRFGMFIHWGVYALPARHEWVMRNERISLERYQIYLDHFDPDLYDPTLWAAKAREAGMKYVVITAKHHDGFSLWDTAYSDFSVMNTPHGQCLLRPFVDAFRAEGIRVGFYYSLIDWHHPHFTFDDLHPHAPADPVARARANESRDMAIYRQFMQNQLRELLTQFGQIDLLWMDFSYPERPDGKGHEDWGSEQLVELARRYQPQILINNRMDLYHTDWGWDFVTPEQFMPREWPTDENGVRLPWETCQTFSGSWGYHRDEQTWKSVRQLVVMLIETVSRGGNLLLNVGPTGRGVFDYRAIERLEGIGEWMRYHSRSIYGATQADGFEAPQNTFLTFNPELNRLYIHVLEWPFQSLILPGMAGKVRYAQLLNDASEIRFRTQAGPVHGHMSQWVPETDLVLMLPVRQPNVAVPVIEIFLYD